MKTNGAWVGYGLGDVDPIVSQIKDLMRRKFASYAGGLADTEVFDDQMVAAVREMQRRYGLPVTGIVNYVTQVKMGFVKRDPIKPLMFTVEGHLSDLFAGPVADTARILESEGHCRWQPTGYNSGAIPFDNGSGVAELARLVGATVMDNGVEFPPGTPWALGGFSQGAIVAFDFYVNYLLPDQALHWRLKDLRGVLAYGPPCRETNSVAPWARPWVTKTDTHGLDPHRRFGLPGFPSTPTNWVDVFRSGDIFAENGDDKASEIKAAVYQAVARGDLFSNPFSIASQIANLFTVPMQEVLGMVMAIISGIGFLATGDQNPHYSPYNIDGGLNWMRSRLTESVAA